MEIFLLLLDEIDDAAALLRVWLPRLLELMLAAALFGLTVMLALSWSAALTVLALAIAMGLATLLHRARNHWSRWWLDWVRN